MEMLENFVQDHPNCRMIVLDTWSRICPRRKGRSTLYEGDTDAWGLLFNFAQTHRIAVVVIHHVRKSLSLDGDWVDEISGTFGVTGTGSAGSPSHSGSLKCSYAFTKS